MLASESEKRDSYLIQGFMQETIAGYDLKVDPYHIDFGKKPQRVPGSPIPIKF